MHLQQVTQVDKAKMCNDSQKYKSIHKYTHVLIYSLFLSSLFTRCRTAYHNDRGTYSFIRKMMALPFLPEAEIQPVFQRLQREATEPLLQFTEYVSSTWIHGTTWSPADWTVFRHAIRTNNGIEGWYHGLNRRASGRGRLPMYLLIKLLHREAMLTAIQIRMVSEKTLRRIQRHKYRDLQAKIFNLWDEYDASERSAKRLLMAHRKVNVYKHTQTAPLGVPNK